MRLCRWGVEIYDIRKQDPQPTIMLSRRFWTRWWATDYACELIKDRSVRQIRAYHAFRPVKVKDYLAAVKKSWGRS